MYERFLSKTAGTWRSKGKKFSKRKKITRAHTKRKVKNGEEAG